MYTQAYLEDLASLAEVPALEPACPHLAMRAAIRTRLVVSRLMGAGIAAIVLASASYWSVSGPAVVAEVLFVAGTLLACLGFGGRMWALVHIAGRKKRQLVRSGPYAVCRHPLYLCTLVGSLGLMLGTGRLTVVALFLLVCWVLVPLHIRREETFLSERFPEYAAYRAAVPALVPLRRQGARADAAGPGSRSASDSAADEHVAVCPRALARGVVESSGFLVALVLLRLLEGAQADGTLPVLLLLP